MKTTENTADIWYSLPVLHCYKTQSSGMWYYIAWQISNNVLEQPTVSISNMKGSATPPAETSLQNYIISHTTHPW